MKTLRGAFGGLSGFGFSLGLILSFAAPAHPVAALADKPPRVEIEEDVYRYTPANNGAGPMWCAGSTCLTRAGERLFASGLETIPEAAPLNNCRVVLFERAAGGWVRRHVDAGRTREPAPLAAGIGGALFLSTNPTLGAKPEPNGGPAQPEILRFAGLEPEKAPERILPAWKGTPRFTEHSYRSLASDGAGGGLVLFQNIGYTHAEWAYRNPSGSWEAQGRLEWPWGAEYDTPQPIRICYPNVAIADKAAHFFGVSDVLEPYMAWRRHKKELTGREWDYDFRRLFYTWTPDITKAPFREWIEIASRDKTSGRVWPCDLWLAPDGAVHLLWTEQAIDTRLREKFFPEAKQSYSLTHAVLRGKEIIHRRVLVESSEEKPGLTPSAGRFQAAPGNRLFVAFYVSGAGEGGQAVSENRVAEIHSDYTVGEARRVPLAKPFVNYFTATVRAGSPPSPFLEMFGQREGAPLTLSYARVRLF